MNECNNINKKSKFSVETYPHGPLATTDTNIVACCANYRI